jgi:hypothetical protein
MLRWRFDCVGVSEHKFLTELCTVLVVKMLY